MHVKRNRQELFCLVPPLYYCWGSSVRVGLFGITGPMCTLIIPELVILNFQLILISKCACKQGRNSCWTHSISCVSTVKIALVYFLIPTVNWHQLWSENEWQKVDSTKTRLTLNAEINVQLIFSSPCIMFFIKTLDYTSWKLHEAISTLYLTQNRKQVQSLP